MFKLAAEQIDKKQLRTAAVVATIYNLLFNASIYIFKFSYYKADITRGILELGKDFLYINVALFIVFLGFTYNRITLIISIFFLFITGAVASYYLYFFGITPTAEVIYSIFNTHPKEAIELISAKFLLWLAITILISWILLKKIQYNQAETTVSKILAFTCLVIFLVNITTPHYKLLKEYFPIQYLHNCYKYLTKNFTVKNRTNIAENFNFTDSSIEDIVGVLVIGESARYDHLGINGYQRNTTPYLSSLANIYSFKAQSCSNHTYLSVPCLLSRQNAANLDQVESETSFLSILTKLGFNTNWLGTQSLIKYLSNKNSDTLYNEVKFAIIPGGSALFKMNDYDEVLLPYIQKIIEFTGKKFLVIHLSGSHWHYDGRYPEKFAMYKPTCNNSSIKVDPSSCEKTKLINSYDNSILYTDFILAKIIELLKDKNAFLLYVADHAESLGEQGRFGHGGELLPEQTTVPFIVWSSELFNKNQPSVPKSIEAHMGKEISHDYVFHTMLDCLGIKASIIDKNLSLCKKL